jgi:hypothetical protein|nr:MAG TPA: Nuclease [Caudoviricetes sp.]
MAAEKTFENKVKKYIEGCGGWQVKFFANRMTKNGIPDILACINGYFVAVEVKAKNGKPSELQKYHVREINDTGGCAIILYPDQYEKFKQLVNYLNNDSWGKARRLVYQINERSF